MNATLPRSTAEPALAPIIRTATEPLEISQLRALLNEQHYLGTGRPSGHVLWQGAWERDPEGGTDRLVAVFCWGGAANRLKLVVQLRRFAVIDPHRRPNLASQCLGRALRELPAEWQRHHGFRPLLAEIGRGPKIPEKNSCKAGSNCYFSRGEAILDIHQRLHRLGKQASTIKNRLQNMKSTIQKITAVTVVAGAFFSLAGVSQAVTFADLIVPGAVLVNGDKCFYNFRSHNQSGDLFVPYDDITVYPIMSGSDYGIRFQSGQWLLTGVGKTYDFSFSFDVKVTDPGQWIYGSDLSFVGGYDGGGHAQVAEVVLAPNSDTLASSFVYLNLGGDDTYDSEVYPSQHQEITVGKDFAMNTGSSPNDKIFVSHIDQIFRQVPEPTTASLFSVLIAGSLLIRRRSR